jgi:hypothetical protein
MSFQRSTFVANHAFTGTACIEALTQRFRL